MRAGALARASTIPGSWGVAGYIEASESLPTGSLMSVLRARRPMLVAVLLGLSLTAVGCGLGGSGHTAGGLKTDPSLAVDPGAGESPVAVTTAVTTNVARGATNVPVDRRVRVTADHGTLA